MKYIKKAFSILIVLLFIFGVFLLAIMSSKKLNTIVTTQVFINAIVAFFGAFFAFSFVKLGEIVNRKRKRYLEHYNAVIKLQHVLNRSINYLQHNCTFLDNNIKALEAKRILSMEYFEIPIHDELLYDLKNIDFINEVYAIYREFEAINLDLKGLTCLYNEIKEFFIEKKISVEEFNLNVKECIERISKIRDFIKTIRTKSIRLFAISKVLAREDKNWDFFFGPHVGKHYSKDIDKILKPVLIDVEREFREPI